MLSSLRQEPGWLASWALLGLWLVLLGVPAGAVPTSLCDYTPPESRFIDLRVTGDFRYEKNPGALNPVYDGLFEVDGVYLADSQTRGATLEGNLRFDLSAPAQNQLQLAPNLKFFQGGGDFFTFFGLDLKEPLRWGRALLEGSSLLFGYGYGRFRDVTPLAKALNIQSQLLRLGKLIEPLPDETLAHIAVLIDQQNNTLQPLTTLISEIQQALSQSNLIRGGIGPISLLSMEKILLDKGASKFCGWESQLAFDVGLKTSQDLLNTLDLRGTFGFRYALAPAPRSQFILNSRWAFNFLKPLENFFLNATANYSYRLSEAIDVQGKYVFTRSSSRELLPLDAQTLTLSLGFQQQSLSLLLDLEFSLSTGAPAWNRSLRVNFGYEFY